ncbi:cytochrome P450 family protein [Streptomyces boncukensis]|uniref:Cytochrome P450 n=1 Tax=Streptomyces boncukensis TaxID=2711219 RepID=A0A6G4X6S8_9ACTN|nr:cytochrome P450 [Streptomyces boncukensis]NGO72963.1 cytochrome P450 [Streptomyces boncukensis]
MTSPAPPPLPAPFDDAFRAAPHARYDTLREDAPVHRVALPDGSPVWLVMRDADVRAGLADPRLSVDKTHARGGYTGFSLPPALDANLLNLDRDDHLRLRRLVSHGFTARRIDALRDRVRAVVDRLADRLADALGRRGEDADLVRDFALPLPLTVIGDLLAVPEPERGDFARWIRMMLAPESPAQVAEAVGAVHGYLRRLVAQRRGHGGDDLLSALIRARDEHDRLSEDELCSLAFLLLGAGIDNVQHTLGAGTLALLRHPEQLAALAADPDALLPGAVEEMLRYAHPNLTAIRRFPTEPVEYGGVRVPAGDTVLLALASANRDPLRHASPHRFDIRRSGAGDHLALGQGVHYCLGAPLARMQLTVALETLLRRFPGMRPAVPPDRLPWQTSFRAHALTRLPVEVGAPSRTERAAPTVIE